MADLFSLGGSIFSAGASLLGAKMSADATNRAARLNAIYQAQNAQADRDFNFDQAQRQKAMWDQNFAFSREQWERALADADKDRALQQEFAKNGVQWRVADARAAGLHPAAALGMQGVSSSPISVGGSGGPSLPAAASANTPAISPFAGASIGSGVASMGQDLSRAIQATRPDEARATAYAETAQQLSLENQKLQNYILSTQVAKMNAQVGPPMPTATGRNMISGQGNSPANNRFVKDKALEKTIARPGAPSQEPGSITENAHSTDASGHKPNYMSKDVMDRVEEDVAGQFGWNLRNRVLPSFGLNMDPPKYEKLKPGHEWVYNPAFQRYEQAVKLFGKNGFNPRGWARGLMEGR